MTDKFWYLTKQSLNKKIKSKWFLGINILLALVVTALININSIIAFFGGDFNEEIKILVIDNTEVSYPVFKETMNTLTKEEEDTGKITVKKETRPEEKLKKKLKDNQIAIVFDNDEENFVSSKIISNEKIDNTTYQYITQGLNTTKTSVALAKTNTDPALLAKISSPMEIERVVLSNEKSVDENMEIVMGTLFPTLILPFFMLIIFLVQMIGGEICEEKTTKSMEIIISNVSPKVHLFSKVLASNFFIIIQAILLVIYSVIGILISTKGQLQLNPNVDTLLTATVSSGFLDKVLNLLPAVIILMILSFIAYSLIAGILASMTTNMEDFSQIQTPIMLVLLAGYYLAIMAGMFDGSTFIRVLSYVPFLSCLIAPSLYIIGQITMIDVIIAILILILTIFLMTKYGLKIYKIGILNYSNEKIWTRFAKAIKSKDV